jgi:Uma2 family endonuclease
VDDKISLYLGVGVKLVWVVYPETRSILVVRAKGSPSRLEADQELSGEPILTGFKAKVADFFPPAENVQVISKAKKKFRRS